MKKHVAVLTAFLLAMTILSAAQQDKSKRPSPAAHAECKFPDGKTIKVDYSSPRAKGRKIFGSKDEGALVPYGSVWRTGANEATAFVTDADLTVQGKDVPAGSYTIFTIPNADKWTLIINKKTGEWGIPYKYESDELARVDMNVSKTPSPVENFTIDFDQMGGSCAMRMDWADTRAKVEFSEKK
ncbi:MAG TPA: DUF2911 domain-containing protein [Terriglobales bacterium]|nr:DUF2911 domain-containing protein [Terriglobales bacterium]